MNRDMEEFLEEPMSAEDMALLDGIVEGAWRRADGSNVEGPVTALSAPERPSAAEGVDLDELKAQMDAAGPAVFSWRLAEPEPIEAAWPALREFVEWTIFVYRFETTEHVRCWWRHPGVVQEWVGLHHLHLQSWSEEDSGAGPNNWHYWLEAGRARLARAWAKSGGCTPTGHVEPRPLPHLGTAISDEEWAELTGSVDPYTPDESWPTRPRTGGGHESA